MDYLLAELKCLETVFQIILPCYTLFQMKMVSFLSRTEGLDTMQLCHIIKLQLTGTTIYLHRRNIYQVMKTVHMMTSFTQKLLRNELKVQSPLHQRARVPSLILTQFSHITQIFTWITVIHVWH